MRLGIDLGGTAIKSGMVDETGQVHFAETTSTNTASGREAVLDALTEACKSQLKHEDVPSIGIGIPGFVDVENGILVRSANLPLDDTPIAEILSKRLGKAVYLENDANCALAGEIFAGCGREASDFLMVTVGTGVGGGICLNKKIYRGVDGRAGEFGHMTVVMHGRPCPCTRIGCWEQYASVTALCRMTKEAADEFPDSLLAQNIRETGVVNGRTAFEAAKNGCATAETVLEHYSENLAVGLNSLITIFRPERIVLAGAIFKEGLPFLQRIQKYCLEPQYLMLSTLNGQAGLIGAALLGATR